MFADEAFRRDEVTSSYPAARGRSSQPTLPRGTRLPLQAYVETTPYGCTIRLPVRLERVTVEKQPVVVEEVLVRTEHMRDTARLDDTVHREELRVDTEGDVRVTERRADEGGVIWQR
ncbi:MAG TPA: DUF2382 domain-containing protein [Chloroflexota bacterium]|nr:DUF2382 domain-containing protein [Chloroflexota bacterium]